jgi:hypothetical protein
MAGYYSIVFIYLFFFQYRFFPPLVLGFELRATPWATPLALFCDGFSRDRVLWTIFLVGLWTGILSIT